MRNRACMIFLWIGQSASFSAGNAIFIQGDEDENSGCVLVRGEVDVICGQEDSIPVIAPDVLGEMQQFEPTGQRTATVQAVSDVETLLFSWHDFVAYAGMLFTTDEQIILKDAVRKVASRRKATLSQ